MHHLTPDATGLRTSQTGPMHALPAAAACQISSGTYLDGASGEHHDAAADGRLKVLRGERHLADPELQARQLADNCLRALKLLSLEREHAGILIQVAQLLAVLLKQLVVVRNERLSRAGTCIADP